MPRHLMRATAGFVLAIALAGCALSPHFETPRLSLIDVRIVSSELWEQRLKVRLRVQNPNDVALSVKGIEYTPRDGRPAGRERRVGCELRRARARGGAVRHQPHDQHGGRAAQARRARPRYPLQWRRLPPRGEDLARVRVDAFSAVRRAR